MISQTITGKLPSKSNSYKIITLSGHGSLAKTKALKDYERQFYIQCKYRDANIAEFFKLNIDIYHENMRPDLDNGFKIILDCLQSCHVIKNDRQCVEIHARKLTDKLNPRIEFTLEPISFL